MEFIFAFFATGFGFWAVILGIIGFITFFVENDEGFWATVALVVGTLFLFFVTSAQPIAWLSAHWVGFLLALAGYVGAAIAWGFGKWYFYTLKAADRFEQVVDKYRKRYDDAILTGDFKGTFNEYAQSGSVESLYRMPSASTNKARIIRWMTYWPFSAAWTLLNDPIRRFFNFLYTRLSAVYGRITEAVFNSRFQK